MTAARQPSRPVPRRSVPQRLVFRRRTTALNLQLFASDRKPDANGLTRGGVLSFVIHTAVIAGAVYATVSARTDSSTAKVDTAIVYVTPQQQHEAPPPPALEVPLKGFQTVTVPTVIPTEIPAVNLQERFDPKDFSGVGIEGGTAAGVTPNDDANQVFSSAQVDQPPALLSKPPQERDYPPLLRQAGITGRVVLGAIIDTLGRAEPASIQVIQTAHPGFNDAAKQWLAKAAFRPARKNGRLVRVAVSLPLDYSLSR